MERLAPGDAAFLYMETPSSHMHVTGVIIVDPSTMHGGYAFETIRDMLASRLHLLPPYRRRLLEVPFHIDSPIWIEDPDFDIENHVHRVTIPPPGTRRELAEVIGDVAGRPLDRSKPLWETFVVEGADDGTIALVCKVHHCAIDGVTGADLMSQLFDLEPDAPDPAPPEEEWVPDRIPSDIELAAEAVVSRATDPWRAFRSLRRTGLALARTAGSMIGRDDSPAMPFTAPHTIFTGAITPHRVVAFGQADLEDLKRIKTVFECKINDVVLAACTMALRRYLEDHDDLPDRPLITMEPVSVHGQGKLEGTNQVSSMAVRLPVHLEDPVDQLLEIREDTKLSKEMQNALGAELLQDLTQFAPPVLFNRAMRLYSRMGLADRHRPVQNLVISNVPGPPIPLYCAGARVVAVYPFGPLIEGAGINITVLSNMGNMDLGVIACRESAPDIWDLADGFGDAVRELRAAADAVAPPEAEESEGGVAEGGDGTGEESVGAAEPA
jgi:WS/DGAT/MGAT family acyltransferase